MGGTVWNFPIGVESRQITVNHQAAAASTAIRRDIIWSWSGLLVGRGAHTYIQTGRQTDRQRRMFVRWSSLAEALQGQNASEEELEIARLVALSSPTGDGSGTFWCNNVQAKKLVRGNIR